MYENQNRLPCSFVGEVFTILSLNEQMTTKLQSSDVNFDRINEPTDKHTMMCTTTIY